MIDKGGINTILRFIHTIVREEILRFARGSGGVGAPVRYDDIRGQEPTTGPHALDPDAGPHTGTLPEDEIVFNDMVGHNHTEVGNTGKKLIAANIINTPAGGIAATDVQAAINELDTEKFRIDCTIPFAGDPVPDGADTRSIGSPTAEIANLYMGEAGKIYFRLDQSVNLYGVAANVLKTDDTFVVGTTVLYASVATGRVSVGTVTANYPFDVLGPVNAAALAIQYGRNTTDGDFASLVFTDTGVATIYGEVRSTRNAGTSGFDLNFLNTSFGFTEVERLRIAHDGKLWLNPSAGLDTNLYRSAANVLKTDDAFDAAAYKVGGVAGVSWGPGAPASITVVGGIVTAIS